MPAMVTRAASELIACGSRRKWSCTSGRMMLNPPRSNASRNVWPKRTTIGTGFERSVIDRGSRIARRTDPGKGRRPREAGRSLPPRRLPRDPSHVPRTGCQSEEPWLERPPNESNTLGISARVAGRPG